MHCSNNYCNCYLWYFLKEVYIYSINVQLIITSSKLLNMRGNFFRDQYLFYKECSFLRVKVKES